MDVVKPIMTPLTTHPRLSLTCICLHDSIKYRILVGNLQYLYLSLTCSNITFAVNKLTHYI